MDINQKIEAHPEGYGNVEEYIAWINRNFKRTDKLECFKFFTMQYDFAETYPFKELKFYDILPFFFCCQIFPDKKYAIGINMHHVSVQNRLQYFEKFAAISKQLNSVIPFFDYAENKTYKFPNMVYPLVWKIMPKMKIAIRRYNFERIHFLREVNLSLMSECAKFWSSTYMGVSIASIDQRYLNYKPKLK